MVHAPISQEQLSRRGRGRLKKVTFSDSSREYIYDEVKLSDHKTENRFEIGCRICCNAPFFDCGAPTSAKIVGKCTFGPFFSKWRELLSS